MNQNPLPTLTWFGTRNWLPPAEELRRLREILPGIGQFDKAGNRLSEQIDWGVSTASYNDLNQLTNTLGGGPMRFAGRLSERGTVQVAGSAAVMDASNSNFVAFAQTSLGTNIVAISATDYNTNTAVTNYQVVVTNNGVTRTLAYDLTSDLRVRSIYQGCFL